MYEQVEKPKENKSRAIANSVAQLKDNRKQSFGFVDQRPENNVQRKMLASTNTCFRHQVEHNAMSIQLAKSSAKGKAKFPKAILDNVKKFTKKYQPNIGLDKQRIMAEQLHQLGATRILGTKRIIRSWGTGHRTLLLRDLKGGKDVYGRAGKDGVAGTLPRGTYTKTGWKKKMSAGIKSSRQIAPGGFSPQGKRPPNQGMPTSAAIMTGTATDQHLHVQAHSHGGKDDSSNVQPGAHSLNTAQIPLDTAVENASLLGYSFWYQVETFGTKLKFGTVTTINVKQIKITLNYPNQSGPNAQSFFFELQAGSSGDYRLNEHDMTQIRKDAIQWFANVMNIDVS